MPREVNLRFAAGARPQLDDQEALRAGAAARLECDPSAFAAVRPLRLSFDARPRHRGWQLALQTWERGESVPPEPARTPPRLPSVPTNAPRVAIVGSGPAGLFCALELLSNGFAVSLVERGKDVRARRRSLRHLLRGGQVDPDSNYGFGEGGAGTYSDGKLYARSGSKAAIRGVLETLVAHGAPPEILVSWRPHIGSNRLPEVVAKLRETLLAAGGQVHFAHRAEEIVTERGRVTALRGCQVEDGEAFEIPCEAVVLATGHSALDSLLMAQRAGARLEAKGFAMGVRIEHPQAWLDQRQYGGLRDAHALPASFYEITTEAKGRGVYSFCMCPGGFIVPSMTVPRRLVVNGMSLARRDSPHANSGLVVAVEPEDWCGGRGMRQGWLTLLRRAKELGAKALPEDLSALPETPESDPLFGVRLQIALETLAHHAGGGENRAPSQRADHFLRRDSRATRALPTSYRPGLTPCDLSQLLPKGMHERIRTALRQFDQKLPGYASKIGQLVGVETRTSSPVRIVRDPESLESPTVRGLYPCGEGAGFAGGIVSAALDGRRVAQAWIGARERA